MFSRMMARFGRRDEAQREESMCERLCQLPQALVSDGGRATFVAEPGVGLARLATPQGFGGASARTPRAAGTAAGGQQLARPRGASTEGGSVFKPAMGLSSLRERERLEENNLSKFLLADDKLGDEAISAFQEMGSLCSICSINESTHYATPCRHSACKVCWSRWLADHPGCMTCTGRVLHIRRYPTSVLPLALYEEAGKDKLEHSKRDLRACAALVELNLERCVRGMLQVKDKLTVVADGFHTVESHLIGITRPEPGATITIDMFTSVLAVERSNVIEQLQAFKMVFASGGDWDVMDQEAGALFQALQQFSGLLDELVERDGPGCPKGGAPAPGGLDAAGCGAAQPTGQDLADGPTCPSSGEMVASASAEDLAGAMETLEGLVAPTAVAAQWARIKLLLDTCGPRSHLIPNIARVFGMVSLNQIQEGNSGPDIPNAARRVMAMAASKGAATESLLIGYLMPEATMALERVRSML